MTEAGRNMRRRQSSGQQPLGLMELADLTAYRIHLQMILERLERLASTAVDQGTTEQHKRLSDAKRFLRGASTCLGLMFGPIFDVPERAGKAGPTRRAARSPGAPVSAGKRPAPPGPLPTGPT